jgi:hypothetical protein
MVEMSPGLILKLYKMVFSVGIATDDQILYCAVTTVYMLLMMSDNIARNM